MEIITQIIILEIIIIIQTIIILINMINNNILKYKNKLYLIYLIIIKVKNIYKISISKEEEVEVDPLDKMVSIYLNYL
jgi:hypothetical protein